MARANSLIDDIKNMQKEESSMKRMLNLTLVTFFLVALSMTAWAAVQGEADLEWQMLDLVNQERAKAGVAPLQMDSKLVEIARLKSQDMIDKNYFAHTSPTYGDPFQMMRSFGVTYTTAGENLAGNPSLTGAHTSLMNSPGHRANILNPDFTHIGIGVVKGGKYGMMITQLFTKPTGTTTPAERPSSPQPEQPKEQPKPEEPKQPEESKQPEKPKKPAEPKETNKNIEVYFKNKKVLFPDIKPFIKNDRVLIPIRFLSEDMGYEVEWDSKEQKVSIQNGTKKIALRINNRIVQVDNYSLQADSAPILYNNRTMVPLRLVLETFNSNVTWVPSLQQVHIQ